MQSNKILKNNINLFDNVINNNDETICLLPIYYQTEKENIYCTNKLVKIIQIAIVVVNIILYIVIRPPVSILLISIIINIIIILLIPIVLKKLNKLEWKLYNDNKNLIDDKIVKYQSLSSYINSQTISTKNILYVILLFSLFIVLYPTIMTYFTKYRNMYEKIMQNIIMIRIKICMKK